MNCPNCGCEFDAEQRYCTSCGADLFGLVSNAVEKSRKKKTWLISLVVVFLALLVIILSYFISAKVSQLNYEKEHQEYPVLISFDSGDVDSGSLSPVPISIEGTDFDGNEIVRNELVSAASPEPIYLLRGSYSFNISSTPIAKDGTLFDVGDAKFSVEISGDEDTAVEAEDSSPTLTLKGIPEDEVSESQISQAKADLVSAGVSEEEAGNYEQAATDKKKSYDAAVEKKKQEEALAARTVTSSKLKFVIPDYWVGKVKTSTDSSGSIFVKDLKTGQDLCSFLIANPSDEEEYGDVGGGVFDSGYNKARTIRVDYSAQWWGNHFSPICGGGSYFDFSDDWKAHLVDISTGGRLTLEESMNWSGDKRALYSCATSFITEQVVPNVSFV